MRLSALLAMVTLLGIAPLSVPAAHGQDVKLEVKSGDTVKSVLERLIGKRVSLVLTTGPELAGVVTTVGDKVVLLKDLTNREFFDGVVAIDQIGAVIVRTRGR
jgi:small nuclear ribonucleoprotein (snRNP)-like protein